jgi:hypothetical protein
MRTSFLIAVGLFVFIACLSSVDAEARALPLEPPDPARGVIGVRVRVVTPVGFGGNYASGVYFVWLVEDGDMLTAESVVPSNYSKGKNVYLLNAKPGRYVAVACKLEHALQGTGMLGTVVFSMNDIPRTKIDVGPGGLVFMGDIDAGSSTKIKDADAAEAHYLRMIAPTAAREGSFIRAMDGNYAYTGTFKAIDQTDAGATAFWSEAGEKHFKGEEAWRNFIVSSARARP